MTLDHNSTPLPARAIMAACCLGMVSLSFATAAPAVCLTSIERDLAMNEVQMGLFLSAVFWGLTISLFISGILADRIGFRILLVSSAACQCVGFLVIASAGDRFSAMIGAFIAGVGVGTADALLTPVVCALFPAHRTRMSNLLHAFYPIGLVLTIAAMLVLLGAGWSWRAVFVLLALANLPYGLAMLLLPLPSQSHEGPERQRTRSIARRGVFWVLLAGMFMGGVTEMGPFSWLPAFVEKATQATRAKGAIALMLFGLSMALGRLGVSAIVARIGARRVFIIAGITCAGSVLMASLPLGTWSAVFWSMVLGFGVAAFWPTILGCAGDRFPRGGASMFSLLSAMGALGGVVGPATIGLIASSLEGHPLALNAGMAAMAVAPVLAVIILGSLPNPKPPCD